jgi:hypothetical protein
LSARRIRTTYLKLTIRIRVQIRREITPITSAGFRPPLAVAWSDSRMA